MRLRSTLARKESRLCGPVLADGALADSPTRRGDRDVQSTEVVDGLLQHLLGTSEVGDVEFVEGPTDGVCDFLALRLRPIQHRYARRRAWPALGGCTTKPEAPPTMTAFLPSISIQLPFKTVMTGCNLSHAHYGKPFG